MPLLCCSGICTVKFVALQSPSERQAYRSFLERLGQHALTMLQQPLTISMLQPKHAAHITYGVAALGMSNESLVSALTHALVEATRPLLYATDSSNATAVSSSSSSTWEAQATPSPLPSASSPGSSSSPSQQSLDWSPPDQASLIWGLGVMSGAASVKPDEGWLEAFCDSSSRQLDK